MQICIKRSLHISGKYMFDEWNTKLAPPYFILIDGKWQLRFH